MRLIDRLIEHPLLDTELPVTKIYEPLGFEAYIETPAPPLHPKDEGQEAFEQYAKDPQSYIDGLAFQPLEGFVEVARFENEDAIVLLALKPLTPLAELLLAQEETAAPLAAVARERRRQVEAEGWKTEHDDEHDDGELAAAAGCYALTACLRTGELEYSADQGLDVWGYWPWADDWWKPSSHPTRNLEKAGALRVAAFLLHYYSSGGQWGALDKPLGAITTKDRLALVTVWIKGTPYVIVDICLRMLVPRELYRAQGFPDTYIIEHGHDGRRFSKSKQVKFCGNSVSPLPMAAIYRELNQPAEQLAQGVA